MKGGDLPSAAINSAATDQPNKVVIADRCHPVVMVSSMVAAAASINVVGSNARVAALVAAPVVPAVAGSAEADNNAVNHLQPSMAKAAVQPVPHLRLKDHRSNAKRSPNPSSRKQRSQAKHRYEPSVN